MENATATSGFGLGYNMTTMVGNQNSANSTEVDYLNGENSTEYPMSYSDEYYYYEFTTAAAGTGDELNFEILDFEPVVLGQLRPALIFLTLIANAFVVVYFLSRKRRKKASNLLFTSIALSDSFTGIALLWNSLSVFAANRTELSPTECDTLMILRLYVCQVFHTVSVWQTLLLGAQRYMCVCHPFISARVCTFWKTFVSIIVMYCCAIVLHSHHLLRPLSDPPDCIYTYETPCHGTCIYMWFRAVLQHLLPSVLLVLLTFRTITTLRKAQRRASTIISSRMQSTRTSREKIITVTASLIVVCFLIPEVPYGIYQVFLILRINEVPGIELTPEANHIAFCVYEILLIVSFHANFWIYCVMMYEFRQILLHVLSFGALKKRASRLRALSSSSFRKDRSSSMSSRNRMVSRTTSIHSTNSDNVNSIRLTSVQSAERAKIDFPNNNSKVNDDDVFM